MGQPAFADMLKKTKTNDKPKKAKTDIPVVKVSDGLKVDIDKYQEAKKNKKIAEAEMKARETKIIDFGKKHQDKEGFANRFRHSFKFDGNRSSVKFVSSNRYSINPDDSRQIREILGTSFDDMLEEDFSVALKPEVFQDEGLQARLMEALGEDFEQFFETRSSLKAKPGFDEKIYRVVGEEELFVLRTFVRQYKPSLR